MSEEAEGEPTRTPLAVLQAPYRREVRLDELAFPSGMKLLRVVIREGHRITQLDIDGETARRWAGEMTGWAARAASTPT